jgi:hypothetical protein
LPHFSTLKMESICSSETSVDFQRTTRSYIPEDTTLHNRLRENLKSTTSTPGVTQHKFLRTCVFISHVKPSVSTEFHLLHLPSPSSGFKITPCK